MWQKRHVNMTKKSANDRCVRSLSQKELYEESAGCKLPVSRKITISNVLISNLLDTLRQEFSPSVELPRCVVGQKCCYGEPCCWRGLGCCCRVGRRRRQTAQRPFCVTRQGRQTSASKTDQKNQVLDLNFRFSRDPTLVKREFYDFNEIHCIFSKT